MYWKALKTSFDRFLDDEWAFITEYAQYKRELYSFRWANYNFFQWWGLFIWMVAFYFNYSLLRFAIYSLSLMFRLLFLPFRVAVELYVSSSFLRRVFSFFFAIFETVGGILWFRMKLLNLYDNFLNRLEKKWEDRKAALLRTWQDEDNNPIVRGFDKLVRADQWYDRMEKRIFRWLWYRLYRYWIRQQIPTYYRAGRRWFFLRYRYLRYRSRRFRKWRLRKEYGHYLVKGFLTHFWATKLGHFLTRSLLHLRWGLRVVFIGCRFLWKVCTSLFSSTALVGRRLRYPREGRRERFRISRYYPRPLSRSSFGHKPKEKTEDEDQKSR